jgi:hypothetical protein
MRQLSCVSRGMHVNYHSDTVFTKDLFAHISLIHQTVVNLKANLEMHIVL